MLAMLCSKPAPMKAKRHQKMRRSFATSSFVFAAIHTASVTRTLQRRPRKKSSEAGADILAALTFSTNSFMGEAEATPAATVAAARASEPARFPAKERSHTRSVSPQLTFRSSAPSVMTRLLPVKSSEPAKTTSVSATPKEAPMSAFVPGEAAAAMGAPMAKMRTMPRPT